VIGKRCKKVSEAEALDYVFGYTLGNDVSERTCSAATARSGAEEHRHLQADGPVDRHGLNPTICA